MNNTLPPIGIFRGLDHEDPVLFKLLEARFADKTTHPDDEWRIESLKVHCKPPASKLIQEIERTLVSESKSE